MLGQKTCTKCNTIKDLVDFKSDNRRIDGKSSHCKMCCQIKNLEWRSENRDKFNAIAKTWKQRNPTKHKECNRNSTLKRIYGIDSKTYDEMFTSQAGRCKVCNKHQSSLTKALAVDHCHITNRVRGLLCSDCNTGLGLFKDDLNVLEAAIKYLSPGTIEECKITTTNK